MTLPWFSIAVSFLAPFCPHPHDAHGWGLRVHNLSVPAPYLLGERITRTKFDVTLINFSKETREHDPLAAARHTGDLQLSVTQPDGKHFRRVGLFDSAPRDPFTQPIRLRSGESSFTDFAFGEFGYVFCHFSQVGRHRLAASIKIDGKTIKAPPIELEVIELSPDAVLVDHKVPLEGRELTVIPRDQCQPVVQQVTLGGRTLLIYRQIYKPESGGGVFLTARLATLPGKCEMTVEGAYGAGNPLTIKYKDERSKNGWTTLVINSISGSPWTEEEERLRIERSKKRGNPPSPIKP